ncbi:MAG: primosomal protein, partial [Chromatiaceae bacterium]|nr:primosomal protein [Chromatiaceae bacterium]
DDLALMRWASAYYQYPLGEALFSALPARLRRPGAVLDDRVAGVRATAAGLALDLGTLARARTQRQVLELLHGRPMGIEMTHMRARFASCSGPIGALRAKGLVESCRLDPKADTACPPALVGPEPNPDQSRALETVQAALGEFAPFLLEGVTGSGKTEVYIRLIQAVIDSGRQALVLVHAPAPGAPAQASSRPSCLAPFGA